MCSWADMKRGGLKEKIEGQVAAAVIGISEKEYDLNLAAIVEHDTQEAELVFHHGPGRPWSRRERRSAVEQGRPLRLWRRQRRGSPRPPKGTALKACGASCSL